jgi:hypothetical protein
MSIITMKKKGLCLTLLSISALQLFADGVVYNGLYYELNDADKTATVVYNEDYENYDENEDGSALTYDALVIPAKLPEDLQLGGGYVVNEIGDDAFGEVHLECTSVTLPNTIVRIGKNALASLTKITNLTLPENLETIGDYAFSSCVKLTSIDIPATVTSIGEGAFYGCVKIESVTFHDGNLNTIGASAFERCYSIYSIEIPNSVETIGEAAFKECSNLGSVTLPKNLTEISDEVFYGCSLPTIELPSTVTRIGDYAFYNVSLYDGITIPSSVISIGSYAFSNYSNRKIEIPSSVTSIGDYAFQYASLKEIEIPSSITSISNGVFYNCSSLLPFDIPKDVTSIGDNAFAYCSKLTTVTIPAKVMEIGDGAFEFCSGLTSVKIGRKVKKIGDNAFGFCEGLKSITIPTSVEYLSGFCGCTGLTEMTIPSSVTKIGNSAFRSCTGLTEITIPSFVTEIGNSAFEGCTGLTEITIPSSVTKIGDFAFDSCTGLTDFICESESPISFGEWIFGLDYEGNDNFKNICANTTLHYPAASAYLYNNTYPWRYFQNIGYISEYTRNTKVDAFGTIWLPYAYTPSGATLYQVESVADGIVTLKEVEGKSEANVPYIYQATEETQHFDYEGGSSDEERAVLNNTAPEVYGVLSSILNPWDSVTAPAGSYVLQTQDGEQAFYKVENDNEITIKPHRAYLNPNYFDTTNNSSLRIAFGEEQTTGVDTVEAITSGVQEIYDLNGRKLNTLQKGINIVNGVKVLVK